MRSIAVALVAVLASVVLSGCSGQSRSNPVLPDTDTVAAADVALGADAEDGTVSTQTDTRPWPRCYTIIKGHYKCTQCHYRGGSSHTTCVPYTRP
jgi:hypothetical protein